MRIRTRSILIMTFQGITQATQVILGMVLVRLISKEMLGSYRQVTLAYTMIGGILSLQIQNSLYYYLPKLGPEKRRELVAQTLIITSFLSIIIGFVMFCTADLFAKQFNNPQIAMWIRIFALFPIVDRVIQLLPSFLISLDKALYSGLYSMFTTVMMISSVVAVFALGYGIAGALWVKLLIGAISAVAGIGLMALFSPQGKWHFDKDLCFAQFNYCWPLMATTIVGVVNLKVGEMLISSYFSREVYAVYSTGALELPLIALFTSSITSAIMPNMVVEVDKGNKLNALNLWHEATRKSSLLIFPTFVIFCLCGYDFIVFMYTPDYADATWPFLIYLGQLPIRVAIYAAIFRAIGCTRPIAISALIALMVNLIVSVALLLIGHGGFLSYISPSIGMFFGTAAALIYLLITLCGKLNISFANVMRWKELGRIFVISLVCGIILFLIPMPIEQLFLKLAARFVLFGLLYATSLVVTKSLKPDEWELLKVPLFLIKKYI